MKCNIKYRDDLWTHHTNGNEISLLREIRQKSRTTKIALKAPFLRKIHLKVNESTRASGSFPTAYD